MDKLRLFGVKIKNNMIRINDMQYLNKITSTKIDKKNDYEKDIYGYINSLGFIILGRINIPKYDFGIICKEVSE